MLAYFTNPSFTYDPEPTGTPTMCGGLSTPTKNTGGLWCIHCFRKGQFTWTNHGICSHCGGASYADDPEVIEMMKGR
jgi:hypothetical protein